MLIGVSTTFWPLKQCLYNHMQKWWSIGIFFIFPHSVIWFYKVTIERSIECWMFFSMSKKLHSNHTCIIFGFWPCPLHFIDTSLSFTILIGSEQDNKINLLHLIVVPQVIGEWQHYSTKTRQTGHVNEQSYVFYV